MLPVILISLPELRGLLKQYPDVFRIILRMWRLTVKLDHSGKPVAWKGSTLGHSGEMPVVTPQSAGHMTSGPRFSASSSPAQMGCCSSAWTTFFFLCVWLFGCQFRLFSFQESFPHPPKTGSGAPPMGPSEPWPLSAPLACLHASHLHLN